MTEYMLLVYYLILMPKWKTFLLRFTILVEEGLNIYLGAPYASTNCVVFFRG